MADYSSSQQEEHCAHKARSAWPRSIPHRDGAVPAGPMACLLLGLLAMVLSQSATTAHAASYNVGGSYSWGIPPTGFSFQAWADSINWYSGDVLYFVYDYSLHNVWAFQDSASFAACDFSGRNLLGRDDYVSLVLLPGAPATSTTVYVGSSGGVDCLSGMSFSLTFYTCSTCSASPPPPGSSVPSTSPPPPSATSFSPPPPAPTRSSPSPPTNSTGAGSSAEKKTTVPVAAIAVPIVLVLVLGACVVVFCCVRRARRRAQADAGPPAFPPPSPLPAFHPIPAPKWAPGPVEPAESGASSADYFPDNKPGPYGFFGPPSTPSSTSAASSKGGRRKGSPSPGAGGTRVFTYQELCAATNNFSKDSQIGKGGFGVIYKGVLEDGTAVAIKGARHLDKEEDKGQLLNEVAVLSRLNHRNLVRLLGCCIDGRTGSDGGEELMLVYELVPNGTVAEHLALSRKGFPTKLDWATRFKIAVQTAEALKYLHVQVTPPIFHRDVKSANILLDNAFNAKVADFGMSRPLDDLDATHVSTMVKGTTGYLDPDYLFTGQLTDKSDVYSLGMVLLELLAAQKPIDPSRPPGEQNLSAVAVPLIVSGRVQEILDPQLSTGLTSREMLEEIQGVAQVAVACLVQDGASRPSMSQVVEMLNKIKGSTLRPEEFYHRAGSQGGARSGGGIPGFNIARPAAPGHGRSSGYSTSSLKSGSSWSSASESGAAGSQGYYQAGPR